METQAMDNDDNGEMSEYQKKYPDLSGQFLTIVVKRPLKQPPMPQTPPTSSLPPTPSSSYSLSSPLLLSTSSSPSSALYESMGLCLAGNRDLNKMSTFVAGLVPQSTAYEDGQLMIGDELVEVNGQVLYGRSHLNVSAIIKSLDTSTISMLVHRQANYMDHMAAIPLNLSNSFRFSSTSIHRGRSDYGDNRSSSSSSSSSNVTKNKTTAYTIATTTATTTTTKITTSRSSNERDLKQICDTYAGRLSLKEKNEKPTKDGKILAVAKVAGGDGTSGSGGKIGGGGGGRSGATCMDDVERHKQITTSHSTALTDLTYTSNNNNNTTPNNNNSDVNKNNNINRRSNDTGSQNEPITHQSLPHPVPLHPPPPHPPRNDVTIAASKQDIPRSDSNDIQFDNEDDDDDDEEDEELMASMHLLNSSNNNNDDDDVLISYNDRHHHHHHQPVTSQISSASSSRHPDDVTDLFIERSKMPLGLRLIGGSNTAMKNVYVSEIIKDGAIDLDGRLKVGDVILEINGHKLDQTLNNNNNNNNSNNNSSIGNIVNNNKINKNTASTNNNTNVNNINKHINNFNDDDIARAYYLLQQNNNNLKLLIKRPKNNNNNTSNDTSTTNNNRNNNSRQGSSVSNSLKDYSTLEFNNINYYDNFTLEFVRKVNKGLGICFSYGHCNNSLLVTNIIKGSAVDIDGRLMVGDEIVAVNGEEIGEGDLKVTKLKTHSGKVTLKVNRIKKIATQPVI